MLLKKSVNKNKKIHCRRKKIFVEIKSVNYWTIEKKTEKYIV